MRTLKIKDIGKIVSGSTPKTGHEEYWNGDIPWVTPKEMGQLPSQYLVTTERKITQLGFKSCSTTLIPKNNVLFTSRAPIGLVAVNKIDVCTNQGFKSIILNDGFDALYVYYYLKSKREQLNNLGTGTTFKELSKRTFEKFEIPVPEYNDQIRIAILLSKVETLMTQRNESISLLDEYMISVFWEMFGDPVKNSKNWNIKLLKNISNVGSSKRVFVEELVNSGIPFYRGTEIGHLAEGITVTPSLFITKGHYEQLKAYTGAPKVGDLLMPSICPDGRIFRVPNNNPFYFKDGRVLWLNVNESEINSIFLQSTLKAIFKTNYKSIASGTTFAELKIVALKQIKIPTPPPELQSQYAQIVEKAEALKEQFKSNLKDLENLYHSLSQRAFKGELDLGRITSKFIDEEIENVIKGNKQVKHIEAKPKNDREKDTQYGDPFDIDEVTAKKQGASFYNEWLRIHGKTSEQQQESIWLQSNRSGVSLVSLKFSEAEGNAIIEEVFAKQNLAFSYQEFETFLKKEKITHSPKQLREFLFYKLEKKELVQHFASKEWMLAIRNPKFNPPGGSNFADNGSIWFLVPKTEKA